MTKIRAKQMLETPGDVLSFYAGVASVRDLLDVLEKTDLLEQGMSNVVTTMLQQLEIALTSGFRPLFSGHWVLEWRRN